MLKSEGKCVYCDKTYKRAGVGRHLATHLKKMEADSKTSKKAYHLNIPAAEMFLHLLVSDDCTFGQLDGFLRAIWLECCGHMSSFQVKGQRYDIDFDMADDFGEPMNKKVGKTFRKGMVLEYDYDFGSTTRLEIKVVNDYRIDISKEKIVLLSRNEPLPIMCHVCNKKPAATICSVCIYEGNGFLCTDCATKHEKTCEDFADYAEMPIVNSPRMGVCAYEGGTIDTERDGVWKG